jgi:hypothetical protein
VRKIQYVFVEYGETDVFLEDDKVIAYWWGNDAHWRSEYMDPLLSALGIEVEYPQGRKLAKLLKLAKAKIVADQGYDVFEDEE